VRNSWDQVQERFLKEFAPREKYSTHMIEITSWAKELMRRLETTLLNHKN